jgi:hypothetical protein
MPVRIRLFFFLLLFCSTLTLSAQVRIASPYSRYGLGDLADMNNAWNLSMGQLSYSIRSPLHVNFGNPASYTAFDSLSFIFDGGFSTKWVQLSSNLESTSRTYGTLGYIHFGFPVTRWWKTQIGLLPFSDVGYNVGTLEHKDGIGDIIHTYTGDGGINRFIWGNGFRILKNLSIGFNFSYLFGNVDVASNVVYPDSIYYANVKVNNYVNMHDIYLDYGIQYYGKLTKDLDFCAGAVFAANSKMRSQADYLVRTFFLSTDKIEYIKDTIAMGTNYKGDIMIPMMAGGGFSLGKANKWTAGIDGKWQNWKKFTAFGMSDSLVNSFRINAGAEIIPDINNYSNYLKRIRYRVGFMYQGTYLSLRGKQLNEYSISLGFGFPLKSIRTMINLGAQVGTRGTTAENLIRETYFKFILGFSIHEKWFVKKKYY